MPNAEDRLNTPRRGPRWPPQIPDVVWGPLAAGALIVLVGALGVIANEALLFPSLGPTAFLQVEDPDFRASRLYNTVVGHVIGMCAGLLAVFLLHVQNETPPMAGGTLTTGRIAASALAVGLTIVVGVLLRASHPPACATTLLFALGGFRPSVRVILVVLASVLLVGVIGEVLRQFRLGRLRKPPL